MATSKVQIEVLSNANVSGTFSLPMNAELSDLQEEILDSWLIEPEFQSLYFYVPPPNGRFHTSDDHLVKIPNDYRFRESMKVEMRPLSREPLQVESRPFARPRNRFNVIMYFTPPVGGDGPPPRPDGDTQFVEMEVKDTDTLLTFRRSIAQRFFFGTPPFPAGVINDGNLHFLSGWGLVGDENMVDMNGHSSLRGRLYEFLVTPRRIINAYFPDIPPDYLLPPLFY